VLAVVREALAVVMQREPTGIHRETRLADLGVDSLALVELAEVVEQRLSGRSAGALRIADVDLEGFQTVGDAVDYTLARL
jgi:acyl carrier protein